MRKYPMTAMTQNVALESIYVLQRQNEKDLEGTEI